MSNNAFEGSCEAGPQQVIPSAFSISKQEPIPRDLKLS